MRQLAINEVTAVSGGDAGDLFAAAALVGLTAAIISLPPAPVYRSPVVYTYDPYPVAYDVVVYDTYYYDPYPYVLYY